MDFVIHRDLDESDASFLAHLPDVTHSDFPAQTGEEI